MMGLLAIVLMSCGSSSSDNGGGSDSGKLSLALCDAPTGEYKAVYVSISEIQVHKAGDAEGQWRTVLTPNATYNLLELVNGNTAALGVADLETGTYTQIRLILATEPDASTNALGNHHPYANYVITSEDEAIELKVPGGQQTGVKLVHNFNVVSGRTVALVLDFDASRSVVQAGNSGKWMLKPTIKIIDTVNNATLTGTVTDSQSSSPHALAGATVSAQIYNAAATTEDQKITTTASAITDENGNYLLYLPPGTYNIVVVADGFMTASRQIIVAYDTAYTENFTLAAATMEFITIALTLPAETSGETATIEFRQPSPGDVAQQITVKSMQYAETGAYAVNLPAGIYQVMAIYAGSILMADTVSTGSAVTVDFTAP